jgi:hypothetical protein
MHTKTIRNQSRVIRAHAQSTGSSSVPPEGKFLPELIAANSLGATKPVSGFTLPPWAGLGIICAYAAVLLTAGGWLLARRDA